MRRIRQRKKDYLFLFYTTHYSLRSMHTDTQLPLYTVQLLLEYGMPIGYRWHHPHAIKFDLLQTAVSNKNLNMLKTLVSYNVDVNSNEGQALRHSVWNNDIHAVSILIAAGADVNVTPAMRYHTDPAIILALNAASPEIVNMLISAGATIPQNALDSAKSAKFGQREKVALIQNALVLSTKSQ